MTATAAPLFRPAVGHAAAVFDDLLRRVQCELFDLGAQLATPSAADERITIDHVTALERQIDALEETLEPLACFILPTGTPLAAEIHVARTVCRRAERLTVELATMEAVNPEAVKYLNRLSDWFFVAGRIANDDGRADVLWVPGLTR